MTTPSHTHIYINQIRKEKNIYSITIIQITINYILTIIKLEYKIITQLIGNNRQITTDGYHLVLITLGMERP